MASRPKISEPFDGVDPEADPVVSGVLYITNHHVNGPGVAGVVDTLFHAAEPHEDGPGAADAGRASRRRGSR